MQPNAEEYDMEQDANVIDALDDDNVDDDDEDDLGDLQEEALSSTTALGVIRKGMADYAKNSAERAASLTMAAVESLVDVPFLEPVVVMQGPSMVKASLVSVELKEKFHTINLTVEGCPHGVQWPHEAPIAQVVEDLRTLDPDCTIGFHADVTSVDRAVKGKALFHTKESKPHFEDKYKSWKLGDGKDKELKTIYFRRVTAVDGTNDGYDLVLKPRADAGGGCKLSKKDTQLTFAKTALLVRVPVYVSGIEEDEVDSPMAPGARAIAVLFGATSVLETRALRSCDYRGFKMVFAVPVYAREEVRAKILRIVASTSTATPSS